jgi:hypothetical protein
MERQVGRKGKERKPIYLSEFVGVNQKRRGEDDGIESIGRERTMLRVVGFFFSLFFSFFFFLSDIDRPYRLKDAT